jgi:hypothetical protein
MIIFTSAPSQSAALSGGILSVGAERAQIPRRKFFAIGCTAAGRWWRAEFGDDDQGARVDFYRQNPEARFFETCPHAIAGVRETTAQLREAVAAEDRAVEARVAAMIRRIDCGRPRL